ncbi:SMC family ATPase [Acidobacteria bacterium AH-259-D05]|nr:SMC family ATPase [Acidobacteria bacterium AH-259-D05]
MTSFQEIGESYNRLQTALGQLLQGQESEFAVLQEGDCPLLVMETSNDSAGFTVVNGSPETAFNSAYAAFKRLYREKHTTWKERNLSFVVCRSELKTSDDTFFSSIETDVYFCRKYVVRFPPDQEGLERELLRLPFLPMTESRSRGVVRPPSAQNLLQNRGVSASLARQLIVPRERSAERIVESVTAQTEPLPDIGGAPVSSEQPEGGPLEQTRIKSVVIEAFRAYRKKQEFDLDADIIVLYGPNGLGKTSFFDAIDYVCTGRIGRLCRRRVNQETFMDLARHLGTSRGVGSVAMEVSRGSSTFLVKRRVDDWGHAFVGEEKQDRAKTIQFLTSADWSEKKERIENLESLFRATHLFSQTDPELLVEFHNKSTLSADLVSRTLALEDYASGCAKVGEVLDLLKGKIDQGKGQLRDLEDEIKELQTRIKSLPGPQESVQAGQQLRKLAAELVMDLRTDAGVTVDDTEVTVDVVHEWRAVIEASLKEARDRLSQLQTLESGFTQFEKNKAALKARTQRLTQLDATLQKHGTERKRLEQAKKKLLERLKQHKTALAQAKAKQRAFAELASLRDIARETHAPLQQWRQELMRVEGETAAATTELQRLLPAMEKLDTRISEVHEAVSIKSQRIQTLTEIRDGLAAWERARREAIKLQQSVSAAQSHIEELRVSIEEHQRRIDARAEELAAHEQDYQKLTANQAELTRLLDEVEAHVRDGVCPTCGTDYRTKVALIERIHAQKEARPAHVEELAERVRELRGSLERAKTSIASLNREQESKKKELEELSGKLAAKQEFAIAFERSVEQAGLSVGDQEIRTTLARLLAKETTEIQASQNTLAKLKIEEPNTARRIKELEKKQSQKAQARKRANDAITPLEQQIHALHSKGEALGLSLDMGSSELESEQKTWATREAQVEKQVSGLAPEEESLTKAVAVAEAKLNETQASAETIREEKEALEIELGRYEEAAAGIIGRDSLKSGHIVEQRRQTAERIEVLEKLTRQALTLERVLDSAQRSAMLAELDSKVQALTAQKHEISEKTRRMSAVNKWFTQVRDILDQQHSDAVADHVRAFGPLTTLLQKRLRAVYGFGDVSLLPKRNEIRVEVGWEGKNVKPTDYFSESQKQILMLSLFLAGRLTQTWSGFAPILLDDPVTHFDDLNAFGFVELIRGLVYTSPGKRQFLISTCEDRLFELMRKKLGSIDGGARFYRFEGIDTDGPVITRLEH